MKQRKIYDMNAVFKNDLGRYSWSNSEFINDVWLDDARAQNLVACKGVV